MVALGLLVASIGNPVQAGEPTADGHGHRFLRDHKATAIAVATSTPVSGFTDSTVISGAPNATAVRFAADGRVLVALKDGRVLVYPTLTSASATVAVDLQTAVHNFWDRGLLGFALDPGFTTNGFVYVLYTYDHVLGTGGAAPRWGDTCPTPPGPTTDGCVASARLSRLTLTNNVAGSEQVLIEDWCQQFPSHSIGTLAFGLDGSLYASAGDGASFNNADWGQYGGTLALTPTPVNPCGDPPGRVDVGNTSPSGRGGALRSQSLRRPAGEPVSLDGAIIRINPATGAAASDNPGAANPDPNAARIVAHGFRNPFRFTFRPGTSELWVGDVGWNTWEEIDRLAAPVTAPVENYGWPCYEGAGQQSGYSALTMCQDLYAGGTSAVQAPLYAYNHGSSVVTGDNCPTANGSAITGVAFYQGGSYPSKYANALFFADHSRNCIWAMLPTNGIPDPAKRELFVGAASNPVDLQIGPGGDLFYVDLEGGSIHRLTFTSANTPPVAAFTATPTNGIAPLDVAFNGTASSDPNGDTIGFAWDFTNDGTTDATTPTTSFRYYAPGVYTARLTVTDSHGASSSTTQTVTANNSAPVPTIASPTPALQWAVGDAISFAGSASDAQDGALPASRLTWTFTIQHCTTPSTCHPHAIETRAGVASGTFSAPDHDYPSYLEIALTATDNGGLSTMTTVQIQPKTVALSFATTPNGLALVIDGTSSTAPAGTSTISRTVIVNSQNSVTAPSPQVLNGIQYTFARWSDGPTASSRTITASSTAWSTPLTATFVATSADVSVNQVGVLDASKNSISWTITVRSAVDGTTATNVGMTDTLSSNVGVPSAFAADAGWSCSSASATVSCSLASLASGSTSQIRFTTVVVSRKANKADNTVRVSSSTADVATGNNVSTISVRLR